jgi:tetratricopeptide (TPR) repeat protein
MMFRKMATLAIASLGLTALATSADAAVSVLNGTLAHSCYEAAEFGGSASIEDVRLCGRALEETALSAHDRAATLINLGIVQGRNNDPNAALESYNRGLQLDATLGEGYVDRGAVHILLKNYKAAVADISKGLELNANRPEIAYYDRAIANEALGNIRDAYIDYKKAVEIRPDFALATEQLSRFKVVRSHTNGA